MTAISNRAISPVIGARRPRISVRSLCVLASVLAVVLFITLRSPLKDDIAWLLYVAHGWMAGRRLYVDLVEVNPPLIIWISAVPLELARWLRTDPQFVVVPCFVTAVLGCAGWAASLLRVRGGLFGEPWAVFAAIGCVLLILPAADLGQREHLLIAAFLPYLALFSHALDGKPASRARQLPAGILAGLGCALKPQYAVVLAALEYLALMRGLRPWRTMPIAAAAVLVGYAALVAILCPAYFGHAVPMALALYGATNVPLGALLADSAALLGAQAVAIGLLWLRRRRSTEYGPMLTLMVFALASSLVVFVDGKNWYYHRLPAMVATVLALLFWIGTGLAEPRGRARWSRVIGAGTVVVLFTCALRQMEPEAIRAVRPRPTVVDRLEQIIRAEHARSYVAFSEWIALGFPVVNETGVTWTSRFDSMWALKGEIWRTGFDKDAPKEWPVAEWITHDFIAGCPDMAVVDTREATKYISVLSAVEPAFAQAWSGYRSIAWFDGLVVYRRVSSDCLGAGVKARPPG